MMRSLKKYFTIAVLMSAVLFVLGIAQAATLTLPADTKVIEEEAFYGDTSLDEVVLPDQIKRIESKAFSKSSVKTVFLPDSLEFIADDAFDRGADINMTAIPGSNAYIWAVDHGFIKETDIIIPSNAGDFEYSDNDDGTCTVTKYIGTNKENIVIPKWSKDRKLVTSIGNGAFFRRRDLKGMLTLPDSITSIGASAFLDCSGFTGDLIIPSGVTNIDRFAFGYCSGFDGTLTIPDSVTSIGDYAFDECSGFTGNLMLPNSLTYIGEGAFSRCSKFTGGLTIPDSITSINDSSFNSCSGLSGNLVLPNNLTSIGRGAFQFCTGLNGDLTIPDNVTRIGGYAFDGCSKFTGNLILKNSIKTIGEHAFSHCSGLTGSLIIPDSVTSVGAYAFWECSGFNGNLTIGNSVTSIGSNAFQGCRGFIGDLTIPDSVTSLGIFAFYDCSGFNGSLTIGNRVKNIDRETFEKSNGFKGSLTIGNSIEIIEEFAFAGYSFSGSLTIGNSVKSIGSAAFQDCSGFTGNLILPDSVTSIGPFAFNGCEGFTGDLIIPENVSKIEDGAFQACSGFKGILSIPDNVTSIGENAFAYCSGFTGSLEIPDTVISIGDDAFNNCYGFTGNLIIPDGITKIGKWTFHRCTGFTGDLIIPDNVTSIDDYAFYECSGFTGSLIISDSVTSIGYAAFSMCSGFKGSLKLSENLTSIGDSVFGNCSGFTGRLIIPESVTSIGYAAFHSCRGFTGDLVIPNSVISIADQVFEGCEGLTGNLIVPGSVASIGNYAFNAFKLKKIPVQVTNSDGITKEVWRTAVNCPVGSYVWSWAESQPYFEPVEWDGDYTSLPEESQLYGAFSDDSMVLTLGEPNKIPAGYVKSIGQDIYRVSITVAGYEMDDPVNNRYATDVFVDHHTKEVNLTDWAAFYLDTTRAPFNEPGEYTIKLWANVIEGKGELLDSMTVYVGWKGYNGTVYTSGGDPLEGVSVFISRANAPSNVLMTLTTNRYGSWQSTALSDGYDYTVEFYYSDYEFNTYTSISHGEKVFTTIGQLSGSHAADACQFEIKQEGEIVSSATVGTELVFEVTAPGATHVKLVVDDIVYDSYYLNDGKGVFKRAITKSGDRRVKLIAYNNSQSIGISAEKVISILSNGDLNPPSITSILAATAGENYQLTWNPVENADQYTIYMYHETNLMHIWKTDNNQIVISGNHIYEEGNYFIEIIASGIGYSQKSGTGNLIAAKNPNEKDLSGTIIDQNNQPINAADVYLIKNTWNAWVFLNQVQTDDNGNFRFEDLTPNCSYSLFWIKDGYSAENEYIKTEAGKQLTLNGKELGDGPLYLSVPGITHWKDANEQVVIVYSPGPWNAFTTENWITTAVGSNENELHIYMTENISGAERSGSIFITSGTHQVVLPVVQQAGDSLKLISNGITQNITKLEKGEACKFLNFLFGDGAVEGRLGGVFGWKVQEKIYDYWRVLIGDTKKLTSSEIISIKKRLLALAESRLLIMSNGVLSADQISHATKAIREYHAEGYISDYDLESGVEDLIDNIDIEDIEIDLAGSFDPTLLMDAHLWNQWCAGASLIENNRRMNSAKQMLYELDENHDPSMSNLYYNEVTTSTMDACLNQENVKKFANILNTYKKEVKQ